MNPLELTKIKQMIASLDPSVRPYAESVVVAYWALGQQSLDSLVGIVQQQMSYANKSMSELTDALKASNDLSDKLHIQMVELRQKQAMFLQQVVLAIVFAMLGGNEAVSVF